MPEISVSLTVNGRPVQVQAPPMRRLLDVLREDLGLTGAKEGCGEGECGACSVILNGELVNSCLIPVVQAQGAEVTTVEAIEDTPLGTAIQKAFWKHGGAQCGICTPGMIMTAFWLLQNREQLPAGLGDGGEGPGLSGARGVSSVLTRETLRHLMAGNLCRCTGYEMILDSVEAALASAAGEGGASGSGAPPGSGTRGAP